MIVRKSFEVFGEPVDVIVNSSESGGSFAVITQVSPPGGGPPPHFHEREDEIFTVLEGEYEIFDGKEWHPLHQGETAHVLRNQPHTFRNCGTGPGKLQAIVVPANGFEQYLEEISPLRMPQDAAKLFEISDRYGITFLPPATPTTAVPV
jgi:quercetin dioxygenase-like cupin family protein